MLRIVLCFWPTVFTILYNSYGISGFGFRACSEELAVIDLVVHYKRKRSEHFNAREDLSLNVGNTYRVDFIACWFRRGFGML